MNGTVYIIRLDKPLSEKHTSQFYVGWTRHFSRRMKHHAAGTGARFLAAAKRKGIGWRVVWQQAGTPELEKQIKRWKSTKKFLTAHGFEGVAMGYRKNTEAYVRVFPVKKRGVRCCGVKWFTAGITARGIAACLRGHGITAYVVKYDGERWLLMVEGGLANQSPANRNFIKQVIADTECRSQAEV